MTQKVEFLLSLQELKLIIVTFLYQASQIRCYICSVFVLVSLRDLQIIDMVKSKK